MLFPLLFFAVLAIGCGSTSPESRSTPSPAPAPTIVPDNPISEIAQREILRRQERLHQIDTAALEANRALSENDLEGAVSGFREASR
jgi:hypothetical protein